MLQGKTIQELAAEVQRREAEKRDFVTDTRLMDAVGTAEETSVLLRVSDIDYWEEFRPTPVFHQQVSDTLGIPKKYYDRMIQEAPELWAKNVNHWLHEDPKRRMVRTLGGDARAFLSPRYRRLDNFALMEAVLPVLAKTDMIVRSAEITESRLWLKVSFPSKQMEVKKGDIIEVGFALSNSEVGLGAVRVEPLLLRLVCMNGAIVNDAAIRQLHIGRSTGGDSDIVEELISDRTMALEDAAFWNKVRDVVVAFLKDGSKDALMSRIEQAMGREVKKPEASIKVLAKTHGLADKEADSILGYLVSGGELSAWGLSQAVSRFSQDIPNYDRATDLEYLAGNIITLPARDWKVLEEAIV